MREWTEIDHAMGVRMNESKEKAHKQTLWDWPILANGLRLWRYGEIKYGMCHWGMHCLQMRIS